MPVGKIVKVAGPLVVAEGMDEVKMNDIVRIGQQRLIGEEAKYQTELQGELQEEMEQAAFGLRAAHNPAFVVDPSRAVEFRPGSAGAPGGFPRPSDRRHAGTDPANDAAL